MPPSPSSDQPGAATWAGFALMGVGMFMAILDVQVVATSLPTIQAALKVPPNQMSWIQTAYLIAEVISIPLTGFLTRLFSMRWLFVIAVTVFTVASAGCAASTGFSSLIAWRVLQGFAGGTLIPSVFSAVFLLFPPRLEGIATTIAGVLAVLAPTLGPIVGGWITQTYSWHWLFLINLIPGAVSALGAAWLLPQERPNFGEARHLDVISLALMAIALSALEIALKEAPKHGWASLLVVGLLGVTACASFVFFRRTLARAHPVVRLSHLADRNFAIGCLLSFVLGVGLFGSVYMMPVFLALVRGHGAFEIGEIMLVTGLAQLVTAPLAVALERRIDARLLAGAGFLLFGLGLALSTAQSSDTDFRQMIIPQVVRGSAIMFCLLPPTRLALGDMPLVDVPDGSGLFNLMRNLGGAIGLALIDTVIYGRSPVHAKAIVASLQNGDVATAKAVGIPLDLFLGHHGPLDDATRAMLEPMVQNLALVQAINEAWALAAAMTFCALFVLPFARRPRGVPLT
jgi:DHA2 family multidrug resistance protein